MLTVVQVLSSFGISVFHNFVAEYMLRLSAYSVLGLGIRYLLKFNLLIIVDLFVLNHYGIVSGRRHLFSFHMNLVSF